MDVSKQRAVWGQFSLLNKSNPKAPNFPKYIDNETKTKIQKRCPCSVYRIIYRFLSSDYVRFSKNLSFVFKRLIDYAIIIEESEQRNLTCSLPHLPRV